MFASKHPFRDTVVIEIDASEALEFHARLMQGYGNDNQEDTVGALLDVLEAFHAGTDMTRFAREDDSPCYPDQFGYNDTRIFVSDPAIDQLDAN
jgi:hypothetical protein